MSATISASAVKRTVPLLLIVIVFASFISLGLPDGFRGAAWTSITSELNVPLDVLGLLLLASTTGYFLTSFFSGRIITVLGAGWTLMIAAILIAVGLLGYALAPIFPVIVAAAFITGLGGGVIDAGLNIYAAAHLSPSVMYWMHASFGVGTTFAPALMTTLLRNDQSWRGGYLVGAGILSLLAVTYALTAKQWNDPKPANSTDLQAGTPTAPAQAEKVPLMETLRLPRVWLSIALFISYAGIEFITGEWTASIMELSRGLSKADAGMWVSFYWGGLAVGRIASGFITRRIDAVVYVRAMCVLVVIGVALFAWNPIPLIGELALPLIGFAVGPLFPSLVTNAPNRVGSRHAPNLIGFQAAAASLGIATLPGLAGVIGQRFGLEWIAVILLVNAVVVLILHELAVAPLRNKPTNAAAT